MRTSNLVNDVEKIEKLKRGAGAGDCLETVDLGEANSGGLEHL